MGRRRLSRWQKASAVVPVALMVGAWGAAITDTDLATASSSSKDSFDPGVPEVPTRTFEEPASVQAPDGPPSGIDPQAGPDGTVKTLSSNGIPSAAMLAYKRAEKLLDKADPKCHLPWTLVAAIGRVESNHGRHGGSAVNADGVVKPGIFGVPLDGSGKTARISDTDTGRLDNDRVWDRAIGPMQFIPSTWKTVGVDADGDGKKNPQDIDDAALATGVYLCAGKGDLSTDAGARKAVKRYNNSNSYVDLVLKIAKAYDNGNFTRTPNGVGTPSVITSRDKDQTLPPSARKDEPENNDSNGNGSEGSGSAGSGSADDSTGSGEGGSGEGGSAEGGSSNSGSSGGSGGSSGGSDGGGDGGDTGGDAGKKTEKSVEDTGKQAKKTVDKTRENVEKTVVGLGKARQICTTELNNQYGKAPAKAVNRCADQLVGKTLTNARATVGGVVSGLEGLVKNLLGGLLR